MELARNMRALEAGKEPYKMRFYIGHDGSIIRLASGLGLGAHAPLQWPALGSEIIMEVSFALIDDRGRSKYSMQPLFEPRMNPRLCCLIRPAAGHAHLLDTSPCFSFGHLLTS